MSWWLRSTFRLFTQSLKQVVSDSSFSVHFYVDSPCNSDSCFAWAKGSKMQSRKFTYIVVAVMSIMVLLACKMGNKANSNSSSSNSSSSNSAAEETGVEKVKPAAGTGNVQGKVLYNSKPVENIEVKLCETFNRFLGGCGGKTYTAKTDKDGDYVITNVPPQTYEGLLVRVFDTDSSIFATTGIAGISAAKYEVVADKTLFATTTHIFKGDLKLVSPKAAEKVRGEGLELKWDSYADAAYYKLSVFANDHNVTAPYVNKRIDGTSLTVDTPLQKGTYRWKVEAFNSQDRKLAESADGIEFTVTD